MRLKSRDKKVLVLGGAASALMLFVVLVVIPFLDERSKVSEDLDSKISTLKKYEAYVARKNEFLARRAEDEQKLKEMQAKLLETRESTAAAVKLEEIIRQIARDSNVRIERTHPIQEKKVGAEYSKLSVRATLSGQIEDLTRFMVAVTQHPKYLLIDQLQVSSAQIRSATIVTPTVTVSSLIIKNP